MSEARVDFSESKSSSGSDQSMSQKIPEVGGLINSKRYESDRATTEEKKLEDELSETIDLSDEE